MLLLQSTGINHNFVALQMIISEAVKSGGVTQASIILEVTFMWFGLINGRAHNHVNTFQTNTMQRDR